jgi:hypothetical protein
MISTQKFLQRSITIQIKSRGLMSYSIVRDKSMFT